MGAIICFGLMLPGRECWKWCGSPHLSGWWHSLPCASILAWNAVPVSDLGLNPLTDKPRTVNYLFSASSPIPLILSQPQIPQWEQAARAKERRKVPSLLMAPQLKVFFILAEKTTSLLLPSFWISWVLNPTPTFHAVPSVLSYPAVLDTSLSPRSGSPASSSQTFWCAVVSPSPENCSLMVDYHHGWHN